MLKATVICECSPSIRVMRFFAPQAPEWACSACGGRRVWAIGSHSVLRHGTVSARTETVIAIYVGDSDVRNRLESFDGHVLSRDQVAVRRIFAWYYGLDEEALRTYFVGVDTSRVNDRSASEGQNAHR